MFEGDISASNLERLKQELFRVINKDEDTLVFYIFRTKSYSKREEYGVKKGNRDNFI